MLTAFERGIISRLSPYCGEPPHERYLRPNELKVIEYEDRLEVFCDKHGNGIEGDKCGSNCLLKVLHFSDLEQTTLKRDKDKKIHKTHTNLE